MTEEEERRKRLLEACKKVNAPLPTIIGYMPEEELKKRQEETREWFEEQIKKHTEALDKLQENKKVE
ncbi:MAG: hypothetical protein KHZ87_08890 [Clostridiales bacterium]|nr:hypothetical protein [Clostridiales bacterium]